MPKCLTTEQRCCQFDTLCREVDKGLKSTRYNKALFKHGNWYKHDYTKITDFNCPVTWIYVGLYMYVCKHTLVIRIYFNLLFIQRKRNVFRSSLEWQESNRPYQSNLRVKHIYYILTTYYTCLLWKEKSKFSSFLIRK